ncbi:hypothetical protein [Streptomyces nigra]|uniref:hypothetical protein n=1 Tax=Streptomyces nigra TaxID=1827580 RepID=UPI003F4D9DAC
MTKIGIIIGSTRPGRNGEAVARVPGVPRQLHPAAHPGVGREDRLAGRLRHRDARDTLVATLDQVVAWSTALAPLRTAA